MSFLPYAKPPPAMWLASFTGSSVLHVGLVAAILSSSVALLPDVVRNPPRAPEYEVTLEILDANIIEEVEPDTSLIPEDAVALAPDDADMGTFDTAEDQLLAPQDQDITTLEPTEQLPDTVAEDVAELLQPEPAIEPAPALEEPLETAALTPELSEPIAPQVLPQEDPEVMSIDDFSPIDTAEISPLAEPVAPAPAALPELVATPDTVTAPDVVTLAPDVTTSEDQTAVLLLPEDTAPTAVVLPEVLPDPETVTPEVIEPQTETILPEVLPEADLTPEVVPEVTPEVVPEDPAPEQVETTTVDPDAPRVLSAPDPATLVIGALIQRIRATPSAQCTLALPRRAGPDGVGVSFIGRQEDALDAFSGRLLNGLDPVPAQTREIVDQRQCALLDAVRQIRDYPAGRIGLAIENTSLRTGDSLRGKVLGAGGLYVTLLLIDDNGVVQDMSRFTTMDGNDPVFDAPVARAGPARATRQIVLALGSETAPIDLSAQIGREAQDVFAAMPAEVLQTAVFGLATVDVR